jgi:hypothetical protein
MQAEFVEMLARRAIAPSRHLSFASDNALALMISVGVSEST